MTAFVTESYGDPGQYRVIHCQWWSGTQVPRHR